VDVSVVLVVSDLEKSQKLLEAFVIEIAPAGTIATQLSMEQDKNAVVE
jgi:hypothetical protein